MVAPQQSRWIVRENSLGVRFRETVLRAIKIATVNSSDCEVLSRMVWTD
jgi:hypothetical protein